eukprot:TRINITY_DN2368_c0_g3_i4.p1 TRINITY_DN2368_c0_g3~~TRINITY_DN2368_c0_g3_i4.p1  ORF type:complete len:285 (-),score=25.41 TRINITY_DN2368_c0_g3_i4:320-1174(-)
MSQDQQEWRENTRSAFVGGLFMTQAFPAGSLFGIPILIHCLLPIVVVFQLVASFRYSDPGMVFGYYFLIFGVILPLTVLIHELGHSLATRCVGGHVQCILLWPLGGLVFIGHDMGPRSDLWISFAGPLTHVPMILAWYGLYLAGNSGNDEVGRYWYHQYEILKNNFYVGLCLGALWLNLQLMIFNLCLPAYPLDGGRILASLLLIFGVPVNLSAKIVVGLAVVLGVGVIVLGILTFSVISIFVGIFMLYSTWGLYRYVQNDTVDQHPMFKFSAQQQQQAGTNLI